MFDFFRKLFKGEPQAPEQVAVPMHKVGRLYAPPDPKGMPGTRVHSEYFAPEEPGPNGFEWSARVYAPGGVVKTGSGTASSHRAACEDAIAFNAKVKAALRGKQ